jgi:PPP family 3-phenylpropionic acid transporter
MHVTVLRRQYLHAFAAMACVTPFLSYVLADVGWSPQQIGAAAAASTVGAVATAPLWGRLDHQRRRGAAGLAFRATAVAAILLFLAAATSPRWAVCAAAALFGGASGSIDPLITARALRNAATASRLGSTRAGGSIGWVLGLGCGATLLTFLSEPALVFFLAAIAAASAPTAAPAPASSDAPTDRPHPARDGVPVRTVAAVLSITFPLGLCVSALVTFTAGWAHTELDAGPLMSVGPLAFSAALELPAFALVDRLGARLRSEVLAALAFPPLGMAALALAMAPGRATLFAVQPLVATTFALMFVSQSRLTAERSTPATMASAQAVVSAVGRAVAALLAGVAGGAIATAGGYPRLFLTMAGICLLGGLRAALAGRSHPPLRKG